MNSRLQANSKPPALKGGGGSASSGIYGAFSYQALTIYLILFLYVASLGMTVVPTISKTEFIVSGDSFNVTSESAVVISTAQLLNAIMKVLVSKSIAGLSDYAGTLCAIYVLCRAVLCMHQLYQ
jgi:hypothetical protein